MKKVTDIVVKVFKESIDFRSYWKFKLIWGTILLLSILFTFDRYYQDARFRGVKVTSVVTGLEYLKQERHDAALELTLMEAKAEIVKWIKEFRVFEVIPPGCYDVVLYITPDKKDKKKLYTLQLKDGIVKEVDKGEISLFGSGEIEFREGFISITYPATDYIKNVVVPTFAFGFLVFVLILIFILKDKEKILHLAEIQENQRFRSLVHVTAGIAHNFRNHLSVIYGQTMLIKKESEERLPVRKFRRQKTIDRIEIMEPYIDGMVEDITTLLDFAKEDVENKLDVNVVAVIQNSIDMFDLSKFGQAKGSTSKDVDIVFDCDFPAILCKGRRQSLSHVFLNIMNNSYQAMENVESKKIKICVEVSDDCRDAIIRIMDNGSGMSPDTRLMAFVPFFTVNKTSGTGLGLSTSRSIIEQSGGRIEIEDTTSRGTTIRIELPIVSMPTGTINK